MRRRERKPTELRASCMQTCRATARSCWTSTRPTTRRAPSRRTPLARLRRPRTGSPCGFRPARRSTRKNNDIREPFRAATLKACAIAAGTGVRTQPTENGSKTGMSRIIIVMVLVAGTLWPLERATAQTHKPETTAAHRAELSYALGYEAGLDLGQRKLDIDINTILRGVQDGYSRKNPEYSPQTMQRVLQAMQSRMVAQARAAYQKLATDNLQKARAFFAENGKKKGVVTLPSGVQYKVLDGSGGNKSPTVDSEVTLQYRGQFL